VAIEKDEEIRDVFTHGVDKGRDIKRSPFHDQNDG
jgi:hypothetical protein